MARTTDHRSSPAEAPEGIARRFGCALLIGLGSIMCHAVSLAGDTLIRNVRIVDGSGAAAYTADVHFDESAIRSIGELAHKPGFRVIDGTGLVLAPGFIDTHSHADGDIETHREARNAVGQGITTAVIGQDGTSPFPLGEWMSRMASAPAAINFAAYAGHNSLREAAMGQDFRRFATPGEVEAMSRLLQSELAAGAQGLSTGLEYEPGIHSEPSEVLALARVAAASGGRYISHVRSEDRWFWRAIDEIVDIGRQTGMPVQVSHLKLAQKSFWGQADRLIDRLEQARAEGVDITADIYPYTYWQSTMMVLIPSRDIGDREALEYALREIAPAEGIWLSRFAPQPDLVGLKLTEIAERRSTDPVAAMMQLMGEALAWKASNEGKAEQIIAVSMAEEDVEALLAWPHSNICSDGGLDDMHPRGAGTFPRVLGRYVRERGILSLESAIHKMTGLAARHLGLEDRGLLRAGQAADLVLFDPGTVMDHATPEQPQAANSGIQTVWVNGVVVFEDGATSGRFPGKVLRRNSP